MGIHPDFLSGAPFQSFPSAIQSYTWAWFTGDIRAKTLRAVSRSPSHEERWNHRTSAPCWVRQTSHYHFPTNSFDNLLDNFGQKKKPPQGFSRHRFWRTFYPCKLRKITINFSKVWVAYHRCIAHTAIGTRSLNVRWHFFLSRFTFLASFEGFFG